MVRHVLLTQILKLHLAGNVMFNVEQLIADPIKRASRKYSSMHVICVMMVGYKKYPYRSKVK